MRGSLTHTSFLFLVFCLLVFETSLGLTRPSYRSHNARVKEEIIERNHFSDHDGRKKKEFSRAYNFVAENIISKTWKRNQRSLKSFLSAF